MTSSSLVASAGINGRGWSTSIFEQASAASGYVSRGATGSLASGGRNAQGQGGCSASLDVLRAYGELHASNTNGGGINFIYATAKFRDNRVTNAPGRDGQTGMVTVKYTVSGTRSLQAPFNTAV